VLQLDHAGGHCHPWAIVEEMTISLPETELSLTPAQASCTDAGLNEFGDFSAYIKLSASSIRGLVTKWFTANSTECCPEEKLEEAFSLPGLPPPQSLLCDSPPEAPYL
jgi:hypothetical protein